MFCYQCEQTENGKGCQTTTNCGKSPEAAILQDVLMDVAMAVSQYSHELRKNNIKSKELDMFLLEALFTTVTNVNFDAQNISQIINRGQNLKTKCQEMYSKFGKIQQGPASRNYSQDMSTQLREGAKLSIMNRMQQRNPDIVGLEELIVYGLKGLAAYAEHARVLQMEDDDVYSFIHEALAFISLPKEAGELLSMSLRVGEVNLKVMALLDQAHTSTYGHPVPTPVRITPIKGKAILVSGHDLKDLEELLKQTEGTGINIYTHGEMLPCHGYPELKKYKHLVGNYGGAWQVQKSEFSDFPGAILMTTNCIQKPWDSYNKRIFTSGHVAYPGVTHIGDSNFKPVIDAALAETGFTRDEPEKNILVGFGHNTVLGVADKVVDAVKKGELRHFFLIGGCDGAKTGRDYYTEFAESVPQDCMILTLACGKYRFNKMEFGTVAGLPRLLDVGQCNDAYSAIKIAVALADAFKTDVNSLPLSLILSWYEQKAVAILLTLLHLGIKNIKVGPTLPAFLTPNLINILVEKYNLQPIKDAKTDLQDILKH